MGEIPRPVSWIVGPGESEERIAERPFKTSCSSFSNPCASPTYDFDVEKPNGGYHETHNSHNCRIGIPALALPFLVNVMAVATQARVYDESEWYGTQPYYNDYDDYYYDKFEGIGPYQR